MAEEILNSFFDVMVRNNDSGYHHLTQLMAKHLLKDILNDTMFELFLAVRKYAIPNSIIEIKAADHVDSYKLWMKFTIENKDLLRIDNEIAKANDMIDKTRDEIIQSRIEEFRNEDKPVLDGFKMVMAHAHTAINYKTMPKDGSTDIQIIMHLPKRKSESPR